MTSDHRRAELLQFLAGGNASGGALIQRFSPQQPVRVQQALRRMVQRGVVTVAGRGLSAIVALAEARQSPSPIGRNETTADPFRPINR